MKICSKCKTLKNSQDFFMKDKKSGRLHAQCKECYKEHRKSYSAEHYKKYGDIYRQRAKIRRELIRRDLQQTYLEYMSDKACVNCGESDIRVLEFDHINSYEKKFGIARGISNGMKWSVISEEINKCQILCANCHKIRTAKQLGWFKAMGIE